MRRSDREIMDHTQIQNIMDKCDYCHLGFSDNRSIYIVPLNFGYEAHGNGNYTLYFHGAKEGRKIDLIKSTHYAGFEMETACSLKSAETACAHTMSYQSIIGEGCIDIITNLDEKMQALGKIMLHTTRKADWNFSQQMLESVCAFKLETEQISCKAHQ